MQLINKTNQFNLTTRRYTEEDVLAVMADPDAFGLQLRLLDRFGDNGIIAIVIGRLQTRPDLADRHLADELPRARAAGRADHAEPDRAARRRQLGARRLVGEYIPTKKNGMVQRPLRQSRLHRHEEGADGGSRALLDLTSFVPAETFIHVMEG